jgi:hypothetical protein
MDVTDIAPTNESAAAIFIVLMSTSWESSQLQYINLQFHLWLRVSAKDLESWNGQLAERRLSYGTIVVCTAVAAGFSDRFWIYNCPTTNIRAANTKTNTALAN